MCYDVFKSLNIAFFVLLFSRVLNYDLVLYMYDNSEQLAAEVIMEHCDKSPSDPSQFIFPENISYFFFFFFFFLTETNRRKLRSIDNRVREIVGEELYLPQLYKLIKKKACEIVRKCLDKDVCTNFREYFETNIHGLNTRNSNILVKLPKVKLEFGRHAFRFAAAKIYNELPKEIRAEKDYKLFRFKLDQYFR